jgi:hypothetical protein
VELGREDLLGVEERGRDQGTTQRTREPKRLGDIDEFTVELDWSETHPQAVGGKRMSRRAEPVESKASPIR